MSEIRKSFLCRVIRTITCHLPSGITLGDTVKQMLQGRQKYRLADTHFHLLLQGSIWPQRTPHHVPRDGEVVWNLAALLDHAWVAAIQKLVCKKRVFFPVIHGILWQTDKDGGRTMFMERGAVQITSKSQAHVTWTINGWIMHNEQT